MLKILIVEDDAFLAATLKHMIEANPFYIVTAIATDFLSALEAVAEMVPDLALVDLKLANDSDGLEVAARLQDMEVLCLLMTGNPPTVPVPDLAIGCLSKPFGEGVLAHTLAEAEDILRDHQKLVRKLRLPGELQLYEALVEDAVDRSGSNGSSGADHTEVEHANAVHTEQVGVSLIERIWVALRGEMNAPPSAPAMNVNAS
jgi:CheY-like chemotaxis protein